MFYPATTCIPPLSHTSNLHPRCTMRIGRGIHPEGVPGWCQGFSLDGESEVRAVKVIQPGNRPGLIYNIGKSLHLTLASMESYIVFTLIVFVSGRYQCSERKRSIQRHSHSDVCSSLPAGQQIHTQTSFCPARVCKRKGEKTDCIFLK